ncbi:MAG: hypothetical protein U0790_19220 [Isosphaeraceae bacterium]
MFAATEGFSARSARCLHAGRMDGHPRDDRHHLEGEGRLQQAVVTREHLDRAMVEVQSAPQRAYWTRTRWRGCSGPARLGPARPRVAFIDRGRPPD